MPWFSAANLLLALPLASAATSPNACPPAGIPVRLPPYLNPVLNGSVSDSSFSGALHYLAPPANFYSGTWYLTNTSSAAYRSLSNLQWDLRPVLASCSKNSTILCPPGTLSGTMADLTTWAIKDTSNTSSSGYNFGALGGGYRPVASIFGFDTPRRLSDPELNDDWDGVFDINVSGAFPRAYSEAWSVVFWGSDTSGVPFMMVHENTGSTVNSPPCLDVWSRNTAGPDSTSLAGVTDALVALRSPDLTFLVGNLGPVQWDAELQGGPAICGKDCQENRAE